MTAVHSPEQLPLQCLHLECATLVVLWETGDILELCVLVGCLLPEGFITFWGLCCAFGARWPPGRWFSSHRVWKWVSFPSGIPDICLKPSLWTGVFFLLLFFFKAAFSCYVILNSSEVINYCNSGWLSRCSSEYLKNFLLISLLLYYCFCTSSCLYIPLYT